MTWKGNCWSLSPQPKRVSQEDAHSGRLQSQASTTLNQNESWCTTWFFTRKSLSKSSQKFVVISMKCNGRELKLMVQSTDWTIILGQEPRWTQQECMTLELPFFFSFQQNYDRLTGAGMAGISTDRLVDKQNKVINWRTASMVKSPRAAREKFRGFRRAAHVLKLPEILEGRAALGGLVHLWPLGCPVGRAHMHWSGRKDSAHFGWLLERQLTCGPEAPRIPGSPGDPAGPDWPWTHTHKHTRLCGIV